MRFGIGGASAGLQTEGGQKLFRWSGGVDQESVCGLETALLKVTRLATSVRMGNICDIDRRSSIIGGIPTENPPLSVVNLNINSPRSSTDRTLVS